MPRWIAVAECFVNNNLYKPGDQFDYDGPQGRAFRPLDGLPAVPVDGEPLPPIDFDRAFGNQPIAEQANNSQSVFMLLKQREANLLKREATHQHVSEQFIKKLEQFDEDCGALEKLQTQLAAKDAEVAAREIAVANREAAFTAQRKK